MIFIIKYIFRSTYVKKITHPIEKNKYFLKALYFGSRLLNAEKNFFQKIIRIYQHWRLGIFSLSSYDKINKVTQFRNSKKPVLRWIKGDGLDDEITRSAIAQATRLFKDEVDYCICTVGIDAARVRSILSWANQPVEWMPIDQYSNQLLASELIQAGCNPSYFGYWWKWFPERVRPWAPEWIMDGDMVIIKKPQWYKQWKLGKDCVRISQSKDAPMSSFGEYGHLINKKLMLYSGIVSLPPNFFYTKKFIEILKKFPLKTPHNGCKNVSEQGIVAASFQSFKIKPIPLYEFPFAISGFKEINYGPEGNMDNVWGYHFGLSFIKENDLFKKLCRNKTIYWQNYKPKAHEKYAWLRNNSQWGIEGSSMHPFFVGKVVEVAKKYQNKKVLELGTSRGFLSAIFAEYTKHIISIDHKDRGASNNLKKMPIKFIQEDVSVFLTKNKIKFDLIFIDLHGNHKKLWRLIGPKLIQTIAPRGTILFYNSHIHLNKALKNQDGIISFIKNNGLDSFQLNTYKEPFPGLIEAIHE